MIRAAALCFASAGRGGTDRLSFDGRMARGRELFRSIWRDVRSAVCDYDRKHEKTKVDLAALIATAPRSSPEPPSLTLGPYWISP